MSWLQFSIYQLINLKFIHHIFAKLFGSYSYFLSIYSENFPKDSVPRIKKEQLTSERQTKAFAA